MKQEFRSDEHKGVKTEKKLLQKKMEFRLDMRGMVDLSQHVG